MLVAPSCPLAHPREVCFLCELYPQPTPPKRCKESRLGKKRIQTTSSPTALMREPECSGLAQATQIPFISMDNLLANCLLCAGQGLGH